MINRLVRLIFKDRMAIVPIKLLNSTDLAEQNQQNNELSSLERTLAQNLANSFQQNGIIS